MSRQLMDIDEEDNDSMHPSDDDSDNDHSENSVDGGENSEEEESLSEYGGEETDDDPDPEEVDDDGEDIDKSDNESDTDNMPEIHIQKQSQKKIKQPTQKPKKKRPEVDEEEDINMDTYLQKFNVDSHQNLLSKHHPELTSIGPKEMIALAKIVRDKSGKIVDPFHTTIPFLTKYERTRVIGVRASQIEHGSPPFIELADNVIDSHTIALMEFEAKQIPFIIARPMPSGSIEYWHVNDLEHI